MRAASGRWPRASNSLAATRMGSGSGLRPSPRAGVWSGSAKGPGATCATFVVCVGAPRASPEKHVVPAVVEKGPATKFGAARHGGAGLERRAEQLLSRLRLAGCKRGTRARCAQARPTPTTLPPRCRRGCLRRVQSPPLGAASAGEHGAKGADEDGRRRVATGRVRLLSLGNSGNAPMLVGALAPGRRPTSRCGQSESRRFGPLPTLR